MPPEYLNNGARSRVDARGDAWANEHRHGLGMSFLMMDIDAIFGMVAFGQNTSDQLFIEFVPDNYVNRLKSVRMFGLVAMFDRKSSENAAFDDRNRISTAVYLWICRSLGKFQDHKPKFFYVIGGQNPPWRMVELNIETGEATGSEAVITTRDDWPNVWNFLGLSSLRREIARWISMRTIPQ
ncbi:MAG: hypothetical protein HQL77_16385 [Magnetococcales bacterium]|nr:hypothetical protein [Magnetococcales bacterium]